jgi:hypothetical protein
VGIPSEYTVPEHTLPLLGGILSMMHFAHRNMCAIVADLPSEALMWQPGVQMGTLAGIIAHTMYCEAYAHRRAAGEAVAWDGEWMNARAWESTADTDQALAAIVEADAVMKRILPTMTVARMSERFSAWGNDEAESGGSLIAIAAAHTAMHWGHMQMTRQLWEQAHPEFVGTYRPW